MKRFFAIILVLLMACNMSVAAFASEFQTYSAMVAIANDINEKGTNLTNDTNSDDNITQQKLNIRIAQISQSELQVLMPLGNELVSVVGTPIARSVMMRKQIVVLLAMIFVGLMFVITNESAALCTSEEEMLQTIAREMDLEERAQATIAVLYDVIKSILSIVKCGYIGIERIVESGQQKCFCG